jgi:hypothetical protein
VNARQIDEASGRLHDLGVESVEDILLALIATGLALAATQVRPVLAMPFLLGAVGVGFLGVRAFVRRTFLVEELAVEPEAYSIPAIRSYGERATALKHRRELAHTIRAEAAEDRLRPVRPELEQLAGVLEDSRCRLEACSVVLLEQWLRDPGGSFRNPETPAVEMRARLRAFLAGFDLDDDARPERAASRFR